MVWHKKGKKENCRHGKELLRGLGLKEKSLGGPCASGCSGGDLWGKSGRAMAEQSVLVRLGETRDWKSDFGYKLSHSQLKFLPCPSLPQHIPRLPLSSSFCISLLTSPSIPSAHQSSPSLPGPLCLPCCPWGTSLLWQFPPSSGAALALGVPRRSPGHVGTLGWSCQCGCSEPCWSGTVCFPCALGAKQNQCGWGVKLQLAPKKHHHFIKTQ